MTDKLTYVALVSALLGAGCSESFDPYNEVAGLRVLGVTAEPPSLSEGERARVDALVSAPAGEVELSWTWCPLPTGPLGNFECAVTEDQLRTALADAGLDDDVLPPFELGSGATVEFEYAGGRDLLRGLCELLREQPIPEATELVSCDRRFPVQLRLDARADGEAVIAVKDIDLELIEIDDGDRNRNPDVGALTLSNAEGETVGGSAQRPVRRGQTYTASIELAAAAAQEYRDVRADSGGELVDQRENLAVTWFFEAGEFDDERTSFVPEQNDIADARSNEWTAPSAADWPAATVELTVVVRDNRGGIAWTQSTVFLEGPQ